MGIMIAMKGKYENSQVIENVVRYITRTRSSEKRGDELLAYGSHGVADYLSVEVMIRQMKAVQEFYRIEQRKGRRMYHEVFSLTNEEVSRIRDFSTLIQFANECSLLYFQNGFQVVFAIHYEAGGQVHIHFAVSTINFRTGAKWHSSMVDLSGRQECFNAILQKYLDRNVIYPVFMW